VPAERRTTDGLIHCYDARREDLIRAWEGGLAMTIVILSVFSTVYLTSYPLIDAIWLLSYLALPCIAGLAMAPLELYDLNVLFAAEIVSLKTEVPVEDIRFPQPFSRSSLSRAIRLRRKDEIRNQQRLVRYRSALHKLANLADKDPAPERD
jgi:hypothetical protein